MNVGSRHAFWMTVRDFAARGKTVIFATHYLEEADLYADRAILVAAGARRAMSASAGAAGDRRGGP
jgi:ABC-2 type transport system ATP-binding protein